MGWMKDIIDEQKDVSRLGMVPVYHNFLLFGNKNDEEVGLPKIWKVNGEKNIPWLDQNKDRIIGTVYDMPKHDEQVIIFVGASPTLYKALPAFKLLDERFVIVATNSSASILVKNGIIPHYVIAIDGRNRHKSWTINIPECKDSTAIFSVCTEPNAMREWPGKIRIVPYGVGDKSLKNKIVRRFGKGIASGGNALNSAVAIFILHTNAKIFLFVGNELSFKKRYYAHKKHSNDEMAYFFAKNIYGEKVKTFIPLFEYKVWLENVLAQLWPEYHFCNCSEGILGVDVDGSILPFISHKPLDVAIKDIREAWEIEKLPQLEKNKWMYDTGYENNLYNPNREHDLWEYVIEQLPDFKKGLDVGCGVGNGVRVARKLGYETYGCDIVDNNRYWLERDINNFCIATPAHLLPYKDNEFDMVICSEVMEHIPEDLVDETLRQIYRVGSDKYIFTIALRHESLPMGGFIHTHITVKPGEWWTDKMKKVGYDIAVAVGDVEVRGCKSLVIYAVKNKEFYTKGKKKLVRGKLNREAWVGKVEFMTLKNDLIEFDKKILEKAYA